MSSTTDNNGNNGNEGGGDPLVGASAAVAVPKNKANRGSSFVIIREIYDSENANEYFEAQLEEALKNRVDTIVIEPFKLGDETARWITVGNWLHKTAVLAGVGSIITSFIWPDKTLAFVPATIISVICTGLYSISWQTDPCSKYQVEVNPMRLGEMDLQVLTAAAPVVLVKKDVSARNILHTSVTVACVSQTLLRLYFPHISQYWMGRRDPLPLPTPTEPASFVRDQLILSEGVIPQHEANFTFMPYRLSNARRYVSNIFGGYLNWF